ncbi:hypothetical protein ACVWW6_008930 [Bradyrhizobium sp. USDA 3311]|nr:hypothetical protein [Bradyrhizobium sp. CCBAU 21362]
MLQGGLSVATKTEAIKPSDLNRVMVDTTVQSKNVMFPTDARLLNRAREIIRGVLQPILVSDVPRDLGDGGDVVCNEFRAVMAANEKTFEHYSSRMLKRTGGVKYRYLPVSVPLTN